MNRDEAAAVWERSIISPESVAALYPPVPPWRLAWRRFLRRLA